MSLTRKILFVLAILAGILVAVKFIWKPSPQPISPNAQTHNLQPTTVLLSPTPSPIVSSPKFSRISLDGQELSVELVSTPEQKIQGLSGRSGIGSDGMLFVVNPPQIAVFWMKDMRFPIDILWIKEGNVTGFVENAPTPKSGASDKELPTYSSKTPVDYVLEVPAGFVKQYGVNTGSLFTIR